MSLCFAASDLIVLGTHNLKEDGWICRHFCWIENFTIATFVPKKLGRDFSDSEHLMASKFNNILGKEGVFYLNISNNGKILRDLFHLQYTLLKS